MIFSPTCIRFISLLLSTLLLLQADYTVAKQSTCYGTTAAGKLKNGVELPQKGKNFVSYSGLARAMGRTHVHSVVADIVVKAYANLSIEHPQKVFKYAETGFLKGGIFKPHKTHQIGLSVDFMVPKTLQATSI